MTILALLHGGGLVVAEGVLIGAGCTEVIGQLSGTASPVGIIDAIAFDEIRRARVAGHTIPKKAIAHARN